MFGIFLLFERKCGMSDLADVNIEGERGWNKKWRLAELDIP